MTENKKLINIRVTATEKRKLESMAAYCGLSLSEYLRKVGLGFEPRPSLGDDFYDCYYRLWCEDNAAIPLSAKSFCSYLKQNERIYDLEYTNKIHVGNGRFVRGFMGIEVLHRDYEIL